MQLEEIINLDKKYFMNTFGNRTPVCFSHGKGINLWEHKRKKVLRLSCRHSGKCFGTFTPQTCECHKAAG